MARAQARARLWTPGSWEPRQPPLGLDFFQKQLQGSWPSRPFSSPVSQACQGR